MSDSEKEQQQQLPDGNHLVIQSYRDLRVYQLAYSAAQDVYVMTRKFPKEELYSLTDQIVRASRSIGANIVEGWSKRQYQLVFKKHLLDAVGSCDETHHWLAVAKDNGRITLDEYRQMDEKFRQVGKMLVALIARFK